MIKKIWIWSVPQIKFNFKGAMLSFYSAMKIRSGSVFDGSIKYAEYFRDVIIRADGRRKKKGGDVFETAASEHQQSKTCQKESTDATQMDSYFLPRSFFLPLSAVTDE